MIYKSDHYVLPLPEGHRFPMQKYRLLREAVEAAPWFRAGMLVECPTVGDDLLHLAHTPEYVAAMSAGTVGDAAMRKIGFPWSPYLVERSRRSSGGTLEAGRSALRCGVGVNLAGGTHHAFAGHGEGFCLFNDSVICLRQLLREGRVERGVVIDLDVHQGNGTASICRDDERITTFSVHGARNYPLRKEQSDFDLELPDRTGDRDYLDALGSALDVILNQAGADLAVYVAGADPFEHDTLGRLALTKAGLIERDRLVFDQCRARGLPVAVTMAGGYAKDVADTVAIHLATIRAAVGLAGVQSN